jgi:general secretion pathway protein G
MRRGRQGGVTLTELLVALAIGALIASIAIPAFNAQIDRARTARAIGEIAGLSLQIERWQLKTRDFPETLADAGIDSLVDPWGNPYRYLKISTANTGKVRRDRNLRPINTDFDLYSMGPDESTQTQLMGASARDDVVRANNGGFLGIAKDY